MNKKLTIKYSEYGLFSYCGYEETTAAYISDMLQYASSGKFNESLIATTKLVSKIEILFEAIAILSLLIDPIIKRETEKTGESNYSKLGKEARTLCKKVVGFMSLISKSRVRKVLKRWESLKNYLIW